MLARIRPARRTRSWPLRVERLEDRALLAGNVVVQVLDGSAIITGDVQSNSIAIDQPGPNQFSITGNDSTTINGESLVVVTATKDLQIDLKGGGDQVGLNGVHVARDVIITTGDGTGIDYRNSVAVNFSSIDRALRITIATPSPSGLRLLRHRQFRLRQLQQNRPRPDDHDRERHRQ